MKSVWVVEEGSYSDYHVVGVFSTKENADRIAELTDGYVNEWKIDPGIGELNQGREPYSVGMEKDGTVLYVSRNIWSYSLRITGKPTVVRSCANPEGVLSGITFATSEEHAVKIANEIREQRIAEGNW